MRKCTLLHVSNNILQSRRSSDQKPVLEEGVVVVVVSMSDTNGYYSSAAVIEAEVEYGTCPQRKGRHINNRDQRSQHDVIST